MGRLWAEKWIKPDGWFALTFPSIVLILIVMDISSFFIILLGLISFSFPFFYIYGIISFFRKLSNKDTGAAQHTHSPEPLLEELIKTNAQTPQKTVREFYTAYALKDAERPQLTRESALSGPFNKTQQGRPVAHLTMDAILTHWYSNNSINLLLYIGAFLIVASASIFVGFQWETIPGVTKAVLLRLTAIAFFGFGAWFYSLPKIKTAGGVFIAIFAILIPVAGAAWYTFYLQYAGVPYGIVWFITSIIGLVSLSGMVETPRL
jgi:hypothetical protein